MKGGDAKVRAKYLSTLILVFTLLLTVCTGSVGWAQTIDFTKPYARMGVVTVGAGVAAASCGDQITNETNTSTHNSGFAAASTYAAQSFTVGASGYTIKSVSVYVRRAGVGQAYTYAFSLCTDNSAKPSTTCQAIGSITHSAMGTDLAWVKLSYPTGYAVNATTRYWIRSQASDISSSYYLMWGYDSDGSGQIATTSADGSTWSNNDSTCLGNFKISTCE